MMRKNKETSRFLYLSLGVSAMLHLAIAYPLCIKDWSPNTKVPSPHTLISVQIAPRVLYKPSQKPMMRQPKPKPAQVPEPKPVKKKHTPHREPKPRQTVHPQAQHKPKRLRRKTTKPKSLATHRTVVQHPDIKKKPNPVFGVTRDSTLKGNKSAMSVRIGNTVMKAQEEKFTPPDKVESYAVIPAFELDSRATYKSKVEPDYPETLENSEVEGEVLLEAAVNEEGKVVAVKVKRSDHDLFSKAAVAALKRCTFYPAMKDGRPVTDVISVPISFKLDE